MVSLRSFNDKDIEDLVEYLNDSDVTRYLTSKIPQPYTLEDAEWWISAGSKAGIVRAIVADGNFVGCIGVAEGEFENERSAEIGYWLAKAYWGRGIATTSVLEMTNYVFSNTDIIRLFAPVFSPNGGSMRVLEKSGYQLEAILKKAIYKNDTYYDSHVFAKLNQ